MADKRIIVGLGELLWDVLPGGRQLGGAPANFAYHASRRGLKGVVVSAVGRDALGDEALSLLRERGLQLMVERVGHPTGTVRVTLDSEGIPTYEICEHVAWDNIPSSPLLLDLAARCSAVCFGSLAQRSPVSRDTIRRFLDATPLECLKIFDINLRQHYYSVEVIEQSLQRADILKINDEELAIVVPLLHLRDGSDALLCQQLIDRYGLSQVVLTCGTRGSSVFTTDAVSSLPTPKVDVVDTVGAGDSFTGAYCAALLDGASPKEAHRVAVDVSAYVCTQHGAMPDMPR